MVSKLNQSLNKTEEELGQQNEHIHHEKLMIEEAKAEGHDITLMRKTLKNLYHFREALRHHRRLLLERLGLYRV